MRRWSQLARKHYTFPQYSDSTLWLQGPTFARLSAIPSLNCRCNTVHSAVGSPLSQYSVRELRDVHVVQLYLISSEDIAAEADADGLSHHHESI